MAISKLSIRSPDKARETRQKEFSFIDMQGPIGNFGEGHLHSQRERSVIFLHSVSRRRGMGGGLVAFAVLLIALENKVTFHWGNRRGWRKREKREEGFAKIQHDKNNLNWGLGRFQSYWRAPPFISPNHR